MKYKTIREGEQAVIYNHLGEGRLVVGPERVSYDSSYHEMIRCNNMNFITVSHQLHPLNIE